MPDLQTAMLLYVTEAGTLALLFTGAWAGARREASLAFLGIGLLLAAVGVSAIGGLLPVPPEIGAQIGYPLSLLAFVPCTLSLVGTQRPLLPVAASVPAVLWFAAGFLPTFHADLTHRLTTFLLALAIGHVVLAVGALQVGRGRAGQRLGLSASWIMQACLALSLALTVAVLAPTKAGDLPSPALAVLLFQLGLLVSLVLLGWIYLDDGRERLAIKGRMDPVTGTLGRSSFIQAFHSMPPSSKPATALLVFRLDKFRTINAARGHDGGDALLVEFAYLCGAHLPEQALFGRTGSAEFSAVLGVDGARQAVLLAETIRLALESRATRPADKGGKATVSVGIATAASGSVTLDRLMADAAEALAVAIDRGGNRTSVKAGDKLVTIPAEAPRGLDAQADRQVAILRRIAATGAALDG